jgi:hypothetical protein
MKKLSIHVLLVALVTKCSKHSGVQFRHRTSQKRIFPDVVTGKSSKSFQFTEPPSDSRSEQSVRRGHERNRSHCSAPTNEALSGLPSGTMSGPMTAKSTARKMVKNLIVPGKKDTASLMQSGLKSASGKALDLSGVKTGRHDIRPLLQCFPVDKIPSQ